MRTDDGVDLVEEDPGLAGGVAGGGRPDGCGVDVVAQMQDHVVAGRTGSGDLEAGRQGPDIECGAVELLSLPRGCDTEQPEHAAQQQAAADAAEESVVPGSTCMPTEIPRPTRRSRWSIGEHRGQ